MFNKNYILHLKNEIEHLRKQNAELLDRFMVMANEQSLQSLKLLETPNVPQPEYIDPQGRLSSMEAVTEKEIEEKKLAEIQIKQMFR